MNEYPVHPLVTKIGKVMREFMDANRQAPRHYLEVEIPAQEYDAWRNTYACPDDKVPNHAYGMPIIRGTKFEVRRRTPPK